jgi:GNAT superfamily N-acetyltransferase
MGLSARAFFGEPFVTAIFGPDPLDRFSGTHGLYASTAWQETELAVGAFAHDVLVGLVRGWPSGKCRVCVHGGEGERPTDPAAAMDWEFQSDVRKAHAPLGDHAWISQVAVEPSIQGTGIGRKVVDVTLASLRSDGAPQVLLECFDHRVAFYRALGFAQVGCVVNRTGADARVLRWAA